MTMQDLTLDGAKTGTTSGGSTGQICTKSGLYKATDGKIEFIEYYAVNDVYHYFPSGNGNRKCTWTRLSKTTDGSRTSFESVKVVAGTA